MFRTSTSSPLCFLLWLAAAGRHVFSFLRQMNKHYCWSVGHGLVRDKVKTPLQVCVDLCVCLRKLQEGKACESAWLVIILHVLQVAPEKRFTFGSKRAELAFWIPTSTNPPFPFCYTCPKSAGEQLRRQKKNPDEADVRVSLEWHQRRGRRTWMAASEHFEK